MQIPPVQHLPIQLSSTAEATLVPANQPETASEMPCLTGLPDDVMVQSILPFLSLRGRDRSNLALVCQRTAAWVRQKAACDREDFIDLASRFPFVARVVDQAQLEKLSEESPIRQINRLLATPLAAQNPAGTRTVEPSDDEVDGWKIQYCESAQEERTSAREWMRDALRSRLRLAREPARWPRELLHDREFALEAVTQWRIKIERFSLELQHDRTFLLQALIASPQALPDDHPLSSDREFWLQALPRNGMCLRGASGRLQRDPELVRLALTQNGQAIQYAEKFQDDREMVLLAVSQNGWALRRVSFQLKGDAEIVRAAVRSQGLALCYARWPASRDISIVLEAVRQNGLALEYAKDFQRNPEVVRVAVRQNPRAIRYASADLQRDLERGESAGCEHNDPQGEA